MTAALRWTRYRIRGEDCVSLGARTFSPGETLLDQKNVESPRAVAPSYLPDYATRCVFPFRKGFHAGSAGRSSLAKMTEYSPVLATPQGMGELITNPLAQVPQ